MSDCIAFTPELTAPQKEVLVGALREAAADGVTATSEEAWFQQMLELDLWTTPPYKPGWWLPGER